ncbi:MAG: SGNH/GDSL hydrolase family protein, partial [Acidobacteriota bacterium]
GATGTGPHLRLLILGDSAAAGVGAASQDEALAGRLVDRLRRDYHVDWRLEAHTGATTRQTIARLRRIGRSGQTRFDVLLTSLGVNDLTRNVGETDWLASQRELLDLAREDLGVRLLLVTTIPPIGHFPALPHPLRWYLGRRADRFNHLLRQKLEDEPATSLIDLRFSLDARLMASDGFHPGPEIYDEWARHAAELIRTRLPL